MKGYELVMKRHKLTLEKWREYDFNGRVYRIDHPTELFVFPKGTTHRVVDHLGIVHCCPAPGYMGCVVRWCPKRADDPVQF
jgi:hypothetical protein